MLPRSRARYAEEKEKKVREKAKNLVLSSKPWESNHHYLNTNPHKRKKKKVRRGGKKGKKKDEEFTAFDLVERTFHED